MIIVVIILSNFKQKIYYIEIILIKASLKYNEKHFLILIDQLMTNDPSKSLTIVTENILMHYTTPTFLFG